MNYGNLRGTSELDAPVSRHQVSLCSSASSVSDLEAKVHTITQQLADTDNGDRHDTIMVNLLRKLNSDERVPLAANNLDQLQQQLPAEQYAALLMNEQFMYDQFVRERQMSMMPTGFAPLWQIEQQRLYEH